MNYQFSSTKTKGKEKILKWIRSTVDYNGELERKPYTFLRDTSFTDCQLPYIADMQQHLRQPYIRSVIDEDMKSDLEESHAINWHPQAIKLLPVCVPKDGNCLLHAASVAVWSVEDSLNTLRDLMLMTVKSNDNFKKRWKDQMVKDLQLLNINQPEVIDLEWDDVVRSISDLGSSTLSVAVPHRFLEGVHIYILSNILRRPIIVVTSGPARSLAGHNLQDNHIGGLYLPLEWEPIECCKTPIVLGYSFNHFCPLVSETPPWYASSLQKQKDLFMFPLVSSDLGFLFVRFLKKEEDYRAWELVQSFLLVKEVDVIKNDTVTKVNFAQMPLRPLESKQNSLFEHYQILKERFKEGKFLKGQLQTTLGVAQKSNHPFYDVEVNSQTEVVAVRTPKGKSTHFQGPQNSRQTNLVYFLENDQNSPRQCITEGCNNQGRDYLENFCQGCIEILTAAESSAKPPSPTGGHFVATGTDKNVSVLTSEIPVIPTAPLMSIEPQSYDAPLLSMMADRCINRCGYRCSSQTYPYCHECYQIEKIRIQRLEESIKPKVNSHKNSEVVVTESKSEDEASYVRGIKELSDPKGLDINHTLTTSSSSENSLLLEGESHDLLSHMLNDISGRLSKSGLEGAEHQNCKYSSQNSEKHEDSQAEPFLQVAHGKSDTPQGRVVGSSVEQITKTKTECNIEGFAESFAETDIKNLTGDIEVSEEPSCKVKCASPYCEILIFPPDKLCSKCKDILKRGFEQSHEYVEKTGLLTVSRAIENQLEEEKNLQEKNAKPSLDTSPQNVLSSARKIESQLEKPSILPGAQAEIWPNFTQTGVLPKEVYKGSHPPRASKGKPCVVPLCPNYGDPRMDNKCSSCYFKSNPSAKPQRTLEEKKNNEKPSGLQKRAATERLSYKDKGQQSVFSQQKEHIHVAQEEDTTPLIKKLASRTKHAPLYQTSSQIDLQSHHQSFQPFEPRSSYYQSDPEPKSVLVTSKTGHDCTHDNLYLPPDSSYSFNKKANEVFERTFEGIAKTWKSSAKKCLTNHCQNYGNKEKEGYCNACYKVIRRQRVLEMEARRGLDVPDSGLLEAT